MSAATLDNARRIVLMQKYPVSPTEQTSDALSSAVLYVLPYERVKIEGVDYFDTAFRKGHLLNVQGALNKRGPVVGMEVFDNQSMVALPLGRYPVFCLGPV